MSLGLRQQFEFLRARHESMVDFSLHDVSWCLTDGQLALPPPQWDCVHFGNELSTPIREGYFLATTSFQLLHGENDFNAFNV